MIQQTWTRSFAWRSDILFYRNNVGSKFAGAHNKDSFDIWCKDCGTTADGVNNW